MNLHTVSSYDQAIEDIYQNLYKMSDIVSEMTRISFETMQTNNKTLAGIVFERDKLINELDLKIEKSAINVLALRQPVGIDLRLTISAIKLAVIIERLGDLIKKTAIKAYKCSHSDQYTVNIIIQMFRIIFDIQDITEQILKRKDLAAIQEIYYKDHELDRVYYEILAHIQGKMLTDVNFRNHCVDTMFIAKNLERIGDYYTKIVNIVNYIVTGKVFSVEEQESLFSYIDQLEGKM